MSNASGDKGKGKIAPGSSSDAGSSLANSAASLLRSALSPNAARDTLQSSVQSSGKASSSSSTSTYQSTSNGSTELLDDAAIHSPSSSVLTGTGFRSSAQPSNLNAEYTEFASSHQQQGHSDVYDGVSSEANIHDAYLSRALHRNANSSSTRPSSSILHHPTRDASHDGAEILALLRDPSLNLADEIDAVPLHPRPTKYKPTSSLVRGLQACEDPVEYIMSTNTYTEDVWDDNVDEEEIKVREAVKAAREEVRDGRKGEAVERLNMVWKHLRAKL